MPSPMFSSATRAVPAIFTIALLAMVPAGASALEPAPPVEVPTFSMDHIHERVLDNGLTVVVVERPSVPIVTLEFAVRNGAAWEPEDYDGLSHMYEHMFFKANAEIASQGEYLQRQRELGMVWNGTTGNERVNYFFTMPSELMEEGLRFMNAAIREPLFLADEMEKEKEVIMGEFDRAESSPFRSLFDAMRKGLYFEHPHRKDPLGSRDIIRNATREQMEMIRNLYYVPNNAIMVIAGDVVASEGFALAEAVFSDWEAAEDPADLLPVPPHPPLTETQIEIVHAPAQISVLQIGWQGPAALEHREDTWAADVLSFILSLRSSGFQQRLVENGPALEASIVYRTERFGGPIHFTAVVPRGAEAEALEMMLAEIDALSQPDAYTDEQLHTAKVRLATDEIFHLQQTSSLAQTLTYWWASADIDYFLNYTSALSEVTREDISRFVGTWIDDEPFVVVLAADEEHIEAAGLDEALIRGILGDRLQTAPATAPEDEQAAATSEVTR